MSYLFKSLVSGLHPMSIFGSSSSFTKHSKQNTDAPSCPLNTPLSCLNTTEISDTCCFEYPGGIFLLTQFWDYMELPKENERDVLDHKFTLHGLWPDNCDGSYEQFCNSDLDIVGYDLRDMLRNDSSYSSPMLPSLEISGESLVSDMELYWKSNFGDDSNLWIHEYNKHGTCIKTMDPVCYHRWFEFDNEGDQQITAKEYDTLIKKRAIYDYFKTTMKLFKKIDTYEILAQSDILPSTEKTYTREEISKALMKGFDDKEVFFKCDRNNAINEIWYYHLIGKGSVLLNEAFVPIDSFKKYSNCPIDKINYYPKGHKPGNGGGGGGGNDKRYGTGSIRISGGGITGFITRLGHWMSKGTEAKFTIFQSEFGNYLIKSSSGYCSVVGDSNELQCKGSNKNMATQFELDAKTNHIGYGGDYQWYSDKYPSGRQQSLIYKGTGDNEAYNFEIKFNKMY